ncbi:MAG: DUF2382 domain-containing protein [Actinomycetota bacterium]|nr:DUF2382 domain-containing protein [Actinomycetota bacterium]
MDRTPDERDLVLREEQIARVDAAWRGSGFVRARKVVDTYRVVDDVPVRVDEVVVDRVPVEADDSGRIETLPDGSISIPVYEEEVVVEKRTILRERVIIRREVVTETERVDTELRKERVEIEADEGIEVDLDDSAR